MCKAGFEFGISKRQIICYKHLVDTVSKVGVRKFNTRVTLSYGFYNKTASSTGYITPHASHLFSLPNGWYFGVNLRIKCEQVGGVNLNQVKIANDFYAKFNREHVFPKYTNGGNDKGVDFFVSPEIIDPLLEDILDKADAGEIDILDCHKTKVYLEKYDEWLDNILKEMEDNFNKVK